MKEDKESLSYKVGSVRVSPEDTFPVALAWGRKGISASDAETVLRLKIFKPPSVDESVHCICARVHIGVSAGLANRLKDEPGEVRDVLNEKKSEVFELLEVEGVDGDGVVTPINVGSGRDDPVIAAVYKEVAGCAREWRRQRE